MLCDRGPVYLLIDDCNDKLSLAYGPEPRMYYAYENDWATLATFYLPHPSVRQTSLAEY